LGGSSDGAGGGAPRAMLLAGAPLARAGGASTEARIASGAKANWMARTRLGGRRVRNGPRRACAGWRWGNTSGTRLHRDVDVRRIECPKCRLGGGAFCWSGPFLTLRRCEGDREGPMIADMASSALATTAVICVVLRAIHAVRLTCSL